MKWRWVKWSLAIALVTTIGARFWHDLRDQRLPPLTLSYTWLVLSAALYLSGLGCFAWYWFRLLKSFGQSPGLGRSFRAYYLGQLGKYLPGKGWSLMIRTSLVGGPDINLGMVGIATVYEMMIGMATGGLVAGLLFTWYPGSAVPKVVDLPLFSLSVAALFALPLMPGLFHRRVARLRLPFVPEKQLSSVGLGVATVGEGLVTSAVAWGCLGLSLWAAVRSTLPQGTVFSCETWARYTAIQALAWVAGFLTFFVPAGLGVREGLLKELLVVEVSGASTAAIVATVLLFRLVSMAAEVFVGIILWKDIRSYFHSMPAARKNPLNSEAQIT
jgi:hypothetical protein